MARPKKQKTEDIKPDAETDLPSTELAEIVDEVATVESPEVEAAEAVEEAVVVEEPVAVVGPEVVTELEIIETPATQVDPTLPGIESTVDQLNKVLTEAKSELRAQTAKVNPSLSYVLIKSPTSTYCFGRIPVEQNDKGFTPTVELLCNIPVKAHSDIANAAKAIGVPISSRPFFHASGLL